MDLFAQYIWGLGVPEEEVEFNDVYGLDEELLEMVPKPVLAVLFLFPYNSSVIYSLYPFSSPCLYNFVSAIWWMNLLLFVIFFNRVMMKARRKL